MEFFDATFNLLIRGSDLNKIFEDYFHGNDFFNYYDDYDFGRGLQCIDCKLKDLLHVLQISSGVSLRLHIFVILGWNTSKLHYFFLQDFFSSQRKIQFIWIKIMVFMISFVKILMAPKVKDQNFWFLSQSQENISNKLFVQSHSLVTLFESEKQ